LGDEMFRGSEREVLALWIVVSGLVIAVVGIGELLSKQPAVVGFPSKPAGVFFLVVGTAAVIRGSVVKRRAKADREKRQKHD
jgi:uncharacterized membrane protein HdeD (DUF308 family)